MSERSVTGGRVFQPHMDAKVSAKVFILVCVLRIVEFIQEWFALVLKLLNNFSANGTGL